MAGQELYRLCFENICIYLKEGIWESSVPSPFFMIPPKIIKELKDRTRRDESTPLYTSGNMPELDNFKCCDCCSSLYKEMLKLNAFKNVRLMSLDFCLGRINRELLKDILHSCTKLEHVRASKFFNIDFLENCHMLESVRFEDHAKEIEDHFYHVSLKFRDIFKNLLVFSPSYDEDCFSICGVVETILLNCPKLVSVGMVDTSMALSNIAAKNGFLGHFNLRRCFWGFKRTLVRNSQLKTIGKTKITQLANIRASITEIIKQVVLSCPYVEELVIDVFDEDCLQYLIELKRLTFLKLNFVHCNCQNLSKLHNFLRYIGPQIKHLSIAKLKHKKISDICKYLPNLESLQVIGPIKSSNPNKICTNLHKLERLTVEEIDDDSALYLLSNCPRLKELYIDKVSYFIDFFLFNNYLRSSSELSVLGIYKCRTSLYIESLLVQISSSEKFYVTGNTNTVKSVNNDTDEFFRNQLHKFRF